MKTAAVLLAALALTACGEPDLESGSVTGRSHIAAHSTTVLVPQYITLCSGKPLVCRQQMTGMLPVTHNYPECWRVDFHDGDRTGHACTTHRVWLATVTGSGWPA